MFRNKTIQSSYTNYRCTLGVDIYKEELWKYVIVKEERGYINDAGNTYIFVVYRKTQKRFMYLFTYWSKYLVDEFYTEEQAIRFLLEMGEELNPKI